MKLFGTSGIRGLINDKLTPELAVKAGLTFSTFLGNEGMVAVGMDARLGNFMLKYSLTAGLLAGGMNVLDLGYSSTPAVLHVVKKLKLKGAVAVTGSHTPPEIHGLLFFKKDTSELFQSEEEVFEKIFFAESFKREKWNGISPSSNALCKILESVGCKVYMLNTDLDGRFPSRPPNPLPEYLDMLKKKVTNADADFGIALDGDGDRATFVDERGNVVLPDYMGALFSKYELIDKKGGVIVCPINTSNVIYYVLENYGGRYVHTRIGPPAMAEALVKTENAIYAFEETGKYIWPENVYYGDPGFAALRLLEILSRDGSLSSIIDEFPKYYIKKLAIPCPDEKKKAVLEKIQKMLYKKEDVELVLVDGVKVVFPNRDWILLRPSGTEPVFRCFVESSSEKKLEELVKKALKIVEEAMKGC
ncbi:MAG: hypothetical protein B6U95_05185 [Thermofilum sp. ex4484_82]|nr:MAG: hypothetical protein B6U95_05185 [Thermofilum sp. ex4484_82]OYT38118.1 MAG: hypothetical protein B6U96_05180 [Archaeoglobales archaeon ex4484_92]